MLILLKQFLIGLVFIHLGATAHALGYTDKTIVNVNGSAITAKEIERALALTEQHQSKSSIRRNEIIKRLIIETLLLQIAEKDGLRLDSKPVEQMANQMIQEGQVPSEMIRDKEQLKREIILNIMQQNLMMGFNIGVSEEEISAQLTELPPQALMNEKSRFHLETLSIPIQTPASATQAVLQVLKRFFTISKSSAYFSPQVVEVAQQEAEQAISKAQQGITFLDLAKERKYWKVEEKWFSRDKLSSHYLKAIAPLSPNEIAGPVKMGNSFYLVRLKEASGPSLMRLRHLLLTVPADMKADDIKQRLIAIREQCLKGEDFVKQVEKHSEDSSTVFNQGDLGWVSEGLLDPAFDEQIKTLRPGDISLPFQTKAGWHIVQLVEKHWLAQNHPEIQRYLAKKYVEEKKIATALEKFYEDLYAAAHITWIGQHTQ